MERSGRHLARESVERRSREETRPNGQCCRESPRQAQFVALPKRAWSEPCDRLDRPDALQLARSRPCPIHDRLWLEDHIGSAIFRLMQKRTKYKCTPLYAPPAVLNFTVKPWKCLRYARVAGDSAPSIGSGRSQFRWSENAGFLNSESLSNRNAVKLQTSVYRPFERDAAVY